MEVGVQCRIAEGRRRPIEIKAVILTIAFKRRQGEQLPLADGNDSLQRDAVKFIVGVLYAIGANGNLMLVKIEIEIARRRVDAIVFFVMRTQEKTRRLSFPLQ